MGLFLGFALYTVGGAPGERRLRGVLREVVGAVRLPGRVCGLVPRLITVRFPTLDFEAVTGAGLGAGTSMAV